MEPASPPALLAHEVEIDHMRAVVFATSVPSARMAAVLAYWEAGFGRPGRWPPGVHAHRVPRLDKSPLARRQQKRQCWDPDVVEASV